MRMTTALWDKRLYRQWSGVLCTNLLSATVTGTCAGSCGASLCNWYLWVCMRTHTIKLLLQSVGMVEGPGVFVLQPSSP